MPGSERKIDMGYLNDERPDELQYLVSKSLEAKK